MSGRSHLIIYPQNVHNVNPDVDDVDLAWERKVKLVIISGQTEMFGERDILVAENLLLGSVGPGEAAVLQHCVFIVCRVGGCWQSLAANIIISGQ